MGFILFWVFFSLLDNQMGAGLGIFIRSFYVYRKKILSYIVFVFLDNRGFLKTLLAEYLQ